jgi:hypothetical protein
VKIVTSSMILNAKSPSIPLFQRGKLCPSFEKGRLGGIFEDFSTS